MSFDSIERSVQDGLIAELYDFVGPSQLFRLTSFQADVTYNGNVYSAVLGARSSFSSVDLSTNQNELAIQIPAGHALAQYYSNGIPPRELLVTFTRYHVPWNVAAQFYQGYASSISFAGDTAAFRVPSGTNDALATDIPSVVAQHLCNNVLGDGECTVNLDAFKVPTTVASVSTDGKTIVTAASVPSVPNTQAPWSRHGFVLLSATNERRTIVDQTALNTFVLQAPFSIGAIGGGTAVVVVAGCDHLIQTCDTKFANAVNHGGHPYMLPSNIFYTGLVAARYR